MIQVCKEKRTDQEKEKGTVPKKGQSGWRTRENGPGPLKGHVNPKMGGGSVSVRKGSQ